MNREELAKRLSARTDLTPTQVTRVLRALEVEVVDAVAAGEPVSLGAIGRFSVKWRDSRTFRSVADFRKIVVDGRYAVHFRVGKRLRDAAASRTPQYWRDPRHQQAWRISETLLGDLALYHRERAPRGIPADDTLAEAVLQDAFGDAWSNVRRAYEAKVPEDVRSQLDHVLRSARARWGSSEPEALRA
jgi:nucleoid DNA-binding protein